MKETSKEAAEAWVSSNFILPRKTINKTISSYGLKHIAERMQNVYISNDDLINAMKNAGYRTYQTQSMRVQGNPNYYFNFKWAQHARLRAKLIARRRERYENGTEFIKENPTPRPRRRKGWYPRM